MHGLGLIGTSVNGTELTAESTTSVASEGTPEVEVQVQNQGESTENGVTVSVTVNGGNTLHGRSQHRRRRNRNRVDPADAGAEGRSDAGSDVETVPGEQVSENNEASYTVAFE